MEYIFTIMMAICLILALRSTLICMVEDDKKGRDYSFLLTFLFLGIFIYSLGYPAPENNIIERRALNLPVKECYTWRDIEIVVFGELQE